MTHWCNLPVRLIGAWSVQAVVICLWHDPLLFQATLHSDVIHSLQHLCFLVAALLFCWSLVYGHGGGKGYGAAVFYTFTTAVYTGVLGALITFSPTLWYPAYSHTTATWGLTPLEDQQLGGLIMWVPAGITYTIAGLGFLAAWLQESESRTLRLTPGRALGPQPGRVGS